MKGPNCFSPLHISLFFTQFSYNFYYLRDESVERNLPPYFRQRYFKKLKRHFYLFFILLITVFLGSSFRLYYQCVVSYTSPFIRLIKRALGTSHIPIKISFVSSMISNFHISLFLNTTKHQHHLYGDGVAPLVKLLGYGLDSRRQQRFIASPQRSYQ